MPAPSEPQPAAPPADRLEFETLISDVSAALMAIPPEQVEPAIDDALDKLRNFFSADCCAVLTVSDDQQVVNVLQASYASGVSHVSGAAAGAAAGGVATAASSVTPAVIAAQSPQAFTLAVPLTVEIMTNVAVS